MVDGHISLDEYEDVILNVSCTWPIVTVMVVRQQSNRTLRDLVRKLEIEFVSNSSFISGSDQWMCAPDPADVNNSMPAWQTEEDFDYAGFNRRVLNVSKRSIILDHVDGLEGSMRVGVYTFRTGLVHPLALLKDGIIMVDELAPPPPNLTDTVADDDNSTLAGRRRRANYGWGGCTCQSACYRVGANLLESAVWGWCFVPSSCASYQGKLPYSSLYARRGFFDPLGDVVGAVVDTVAQAVPTLQPWDYCEARISLSNANYFDIFKVLNLGAYTTCSGCQIERFQAVFGYTARFELRISNYQIKSCTATMSVYGNSDIQIFIPVDSTFSIAKTIRLMSSTPVMFLSGLFNFNIGAFLYVDLQLSASIQAANEMHLSVYFSKTYTNTLTYDPNSKNFLATRTESGSGLQTSGLNSLTQVSFFKNLQFKVTIIPGVELNIAWFMTINVQAEPAFEVLIPTVSLTEPACVKLNFEIVLRVKWTDFVVSFYLYGFGDIPLLDLPIGRDFPFVLLPSTTVLAMGCNKCGAATSYSKNGNPAFCVNDLSAAFSRHGISGSICTACEVGKYFPRDERNYCTVCRNCPPTTYQSSTGQFGCLSCSTSCLANQYISAPCSATLNTQCSTCPMCEAGKYTSSVCTPAAKTVCLTCGANSYQLYAGQSSCTPCRAACSIGTTESVPCTPTTNRVCVTESGTYFLCSVPNSVSVSGTGRFISGTQTQPYANNQACFTTLIIPSGYRASMSCTHSTETTYDYFAVIYGYPGIYSNFLAASGFASSYPTFSGIGTVIGSDMLNEILIIWKTDGSVTEGNGFSCDYAITSLPKCGAGQYLNASSFSCTACPAGMYQSATQHSLFSCMACPWGMFQPNTGQSSCISCSACPVGSSESTACSATSDRYCTPASGSYFICQLPSLSIALPASAMQTLFSGSVYSRYVNSQACYGTFTVPAGSQATLQCDVETENSYDYVKIGVGETRIFSTYSDASSALTAQQKYTGAIAGVNIANIIRGFALTWFTDSSVTTGAGFTCTISTSVLPVCSYGEYVAATADKCNPCPTGTYQSLGMHSLFSCSPCPSGTYQMSTKQSICNTCRTCVSGTVVSSECAPQINRVCQPSLGNYFICGLPSNVVEFSASGMIYSGTTDTPYINYQNCWGTFRVPAGKLVTIQCNVSSEPLYDYIAFQTESSATFESFSEIYYSIFNAPKHSGNITLPSVNAFDGVAFLWRTDETVVKGTGFQCRYALSNLSTCTAGQYVSKSLNCAPCPVGQNQSKTVHSAYSCGTCPAGTFSNTTGNLYCSPCRSTCESDLVETVSCSASTDRQCGRFAGVYYLCDEKFGQNITLRGSGQIQSGNLTHSYANNQQCVKNFVLSEGYSLRLSCNVSSELGYDGLFVSPDKFDNMTMNFQQSFPISNGSSNNFISAMTLSGNVSGDFGPLLIGAQILWTTDSSTIGGFGAVCSFTVTASPICGSGQRFGQDAGGNLACFACAAGFYQPLPAHRATACIPCSNSSYQPNTGQDRCIACRTCFAGTNQTVACQATVNRECAILPNQYFLCNRNRSTVPLTGSGSIFSGFADAPYDSNQTCWAAFTVANYSKVSFACNVSTQQGADYLVNHPGSSAPNSSLAALQNNSQVLSGYISNFQLSDSALGTTMVWNTDASVVQGTGAVCSFAVQPIPACTSGTRLQPIGAFCANCTPGTYQSSAGHWSTDCPACSANTFQPQARATSCLACHVCLPGSFVAQTCSALADSICAPCADETFQPGTNQYSCATCTSCGSGTFKATPCSHDRDTICTTCGTGFFQSEVNQATCNKCSTCRAGQYTTSTCNVTHDTQCSVCADNFFAPVANSDRCLPCKECPEGQYSTSPCNETTDAMCELCPAGQFSSSSGQRNCKVCEAGFFQPNRGQNACQACQTCSGSGVVMQANCSKTVDSQCVTFPETCPVVKVNQGFKTAVAVDTCPLAETPCLTGVAAPDCCSACATMPSCVAWLYQITGSLSGACWLYASTSGFGVSNNSVIGLMTVSEENFSSSAGASSSVPVIRSALLWGPVAGAIALLLLVVVLVFVLVIRRRRRDRGVQQKPAANSVGNFKNSADESTTAPPVAMMRSYRAGTLWSLSNLPGIPAGTDGDFGDGQYMRLPFNGVYTASGMNYDVLGSRDSELLQPESQNWGVSNGMYGALALHAGSTAAKPNIRNESFFANTDMAHGYTFVSDMDTNGYTLIGTPGEVPSDPIGSSETEFDLPVSNQLGNIMEQQHFSGVNGGGELFLMTKDEMDEPERLPPQQTRGYCAPKEDSFAGFENGDA
jgi:hypothetical protein